jgi:hypothetical protein
MRRSLPVILLIILTLLCFSTLSYSQTGKVWVTIPSDVDTPYLGTDGRWKANDSAFNAQINLLEISSSGKALPASRNATLQRVYELTCNCLQAELEDRLSTNVSVVSGVQRAPVYDTLHTPNDYNIQPGMNNYALNLINAQTAWDITTGDTNVVIGISDQGYSPTHSELVGKYVYLNSGSNFTTHGNAVSILAAGRTNNNNGLSSIGYDCKLWLGNMNYSSMLAAAYAGIRVINLSWASGCYYNIYEQQAVNEAYAAGAFIVAAAGNGNTCGNGNSGAYVYPAAYNNVFSVTSIGPNDNHMRIPNDTTSTHQHNNQVDLSAPGYDVAVNPFEGWYIQSSGTSFAAPYVSGTIGLMLSQNPCLSRKDIDTILRITSVNIDTLNPLYAGKLGAGRLNAQAAVQLASGWATNPMAVTLQPVGTSATVGSTIQLTSASTSSFPVYQWQIDSSGIFVNLNNNATYSGVKTATLTISGVSLLLNNKSYRCVMTSGYCQAISDPATLSVSVGNIPGDVETIYGDTTLCVGAISSFWINSVPGATSYNWTISGVSSIVSGQGTDSIQVAVYDSSVIITVTPVNVTGNGGAATLTVYTVPVATALLSGSTTICAGDSALLTINFTGQGPWSGSINQNIPFTCNTNPCYVAVHPSVTTDYSITELQTDSCFSGADALSGNVTVTVIPAVFDTITHTVCPGQLPYVWNGNSYFSAGNFNDTLTGVAGCDSIVTLILTVVNNVIPNAPASITQVLVSNVCNSRIYRFTAALTANSVGYSWMIPSGCGGVAGVTVDSGNINSSRIIKLKFTSNNAALLTDSIRVRAFNACGMGPFRAAKLNNTALNVPVLPASITVTPILTNVCGERKYRYKAPNLPSATASNTAATGYLWSFSSPLPLQVQLDSGTFNSQTIVVKYVSNAAAAPGDSIYVQYASACGYSAKRASKINVAALNPPAAPVSITMTTLTASICGERRYRFSMPLTPGSTVSTAAANGYEWVLIGNLAAYGVVDSGSLNSRVVVIKYTNDNATIVGDSIKARYLSDCGPGAFRAFKFTVPKLNPPLAPASISITAVSTNICGARKYRYRAPTLPAATVNYAAATGYSWDFTGILGADAVVDSGSLTSQTLRVIFSSNAAAQIGDSVRVLYTSACGNSPRRSVKLTNTLLLPPAAPTSIGIELKQDVCNARKYRYIAPATLPAATASRGAGSGYLWSMPIGSLGITGVLDSGTLNSQKIVIVYSSNAAAATGDSIHLRYTSACGNGDVRARKLTNTFKFGCQQITGKMPYTGDEAANQPNSLQLQVTPNPSRTDFRLLVNSKYAEAIIVRVFDMQGRLLIPMRIAAGNALSIGGQLPPGTYILEVRQGKEIRSMKLLKY